jgi:hypothetical protein
VLAAYKQTLQIATVSAVITLAPATFTATLAAVSSLPLIAVAAFALWALAMVAIAPTRARVERHSDDADAHGLDLPVVLFQPTRTD